MRLNFGRRLVLFVHWLLSLAGCALAVTMIVWPECLATALALLERQGLVFKIYAIAVLAVYLIFAVGAVCIILGGKKQKEKNAFIIVDSSETGRTRIAVGAVDQMIRQAVRGVDGIAEMKSNIINNGDSIAIATDVAILNGAHVPTVTSNIQRAIRGYIEQNCGVAVRGVSVSVHSLAEAESGGRRGRKKKTEVNSYTNPTSVGNSAAAPSKPDSAASYAEPAPRPALFDEPEPVADSLPEAAPVSEPEAADDAIFPDADEPISLTLDPAPEAQEPAAEPVEAADEVSAEPEPAPEEAPAAQDAPGPEAAPAPKKRRFGRFFGKREEPASDGGTDGGQDTPV